MQQANNALPSGREGVGALLSLPPNLVGCFHEITGLPPEGWFCTSDPVGHKLGSGGGTAHLLLEAHRTMAPDTEFYDWLAQEKRILLHAGGQGRRLPAYAPSGKILTPIPVFRWERGQRLSQNLLDIQMPLYRKIMAAAPDSLHIMVVSGDVFIRSTEPLQAIPEADVVCYGLWLGPEIAKDHGVFVADRKTPGQLKCMMQKPSVETLGELLKDHFYLTDIGIWLLSDKAVQRLMQKASNEGKAIGYDLYSDFGRALGTQPEISDPLLSDLSVAILPLTGGEFYHFGTSHELLSSMLDIQNLVNDQRRIIHRDRHDAIDIHLVRLSLAIGAHLFQFGHNSHVKRSRRIAEAYALLRHVWLHTQVLLQVLTLGDSVLRYLAILVSTLQLIASIRINGIELCLERHRTCLSGVVESLLISFFLLCHNLFLL